MRKKIFIPACLIAASLCSPAFAQVNDTYFDCTTDTLSVNGSIEGASAGEAATLFIAPADSDVFVPILSDMFYMENDDTFFRDIHFHSSFVSGKYEIRAGSEKSTAPYKGSAIIFDENSTEIKSLIDSINECATANELVALMGSDGKDKLVFTDSDYSADALKLCFKLKEKIDDKKYDAASFVQTYYYAYASAMLTNGVAPDTVMKDFSRFFDATYDDYISSEFKDEIDALCPAIDYGSEFVTLDTMELIAEVRSFDNAGNLWDFVEDNYEKLGIPESVMKKYNKLSANYQNKVFASMIKKTEDAASLPEVAEHFEDAVDDQTKASQNKSSSSGGGGSSGSSFGGSVTNPPFQSQVSVSTNPLPEAPVIAEPEIVFSDMENHWSKEDVYALAKKGIINGYADSTFRPDGYVTRAELAKLIANAFSLTASANTISFADVSDDAWYYDSVIALAQAGIIKGNGNGFNPDSFITRQDAATMISRALAYLEINKTVSTISFNDENDIAEYAVEHVDALSSLGIIKGSDNHFYPKSNITRAEISAIINRAYNIWGGAAK